MSSRKQPARRLDAASEPGREARSEHAAEGSDPDRSADRAGERDQARRDAALALRHDVLDGQDLRERGWSESGAHHRARDADPRHARIEHCPTNEPASRNGDQDRAAKRRPPETGAYDDPRRERGGEGPHEHERRHHGSGRRRRSAAGALDEEGHERVDAEDRRPEPIPANRGEEVCQLANRSEEEGAPAGSRTSRARRARRLRRPETGAGTRQFRRQGRAREAESRSVTARRQPRAAGNVDRVRQLGTRLDHLRRHEVERDHTERNVDREDGPPAEVHGQERAEERADEARESPHSREQTLHAGALLERKQIGRDCQGDGNEPRRAQTLETPGGDR